MNYKRGIVWFRQDLRLHDNEALCDAMDAVDEVLPVYVFDERVFKGETRFGFPKTGRHRARFILESVRDLRRSLRSKGTDLVVRYGKPEEEIYEIARMAKSNWVFCNRERTEEEVAVQDALEQNLWSIGQELRYSRGKMLYYTADLPFPVTHCPDTFSQFRKETEKIVPVRDPLPTPDKLDAFTAEIPHGELPDQSELGIHDMSTDPRAVIEFKGGETTGLNRLKEYFWESADPKTYYKTRNQLLGPDYSTKFSAWLAQGCLSPKRIYHELLKFEDREGENKSTYWIFYELQWRDFFRLMYKKHGNLMFQTGGIKQQPDPEWEVDEEVIDRWSQGSTGIPFIDANMREIEATGYMSNRGRQNVASFLIHDLKQNWLVGAECFESRLIDYDPCSNYGNWNYIAGVGNDPRDERSYNIIRQAERYDPKGAYVKKWIPELKDLPKEFVHTPAEAPGEVLEEAGIELGEDYPEPIIDFNRWVY